MLGYPGIVLLMAMESSCLPVPSEIIMPFSGYLASTGRFSLVLATTAGAIGCSLGSTFLYYLGATGGRSLARRWERFFSAAKLARVERYFERYGSATIFFARILPMVPVVVSFPAGVAKMSIWKFQIYTFAGSWLWCFALALMGFEFGLAWETTPWLKTAMHWIDKGIAAALVLGILWFAWRGLRALSAARVR